MQNFKVLIDIALIAVCTTYRFHAEGNRTFEAHLVVLILLRMHDMNKGFGVFCCSVSLKTFSLVQKYFLI